MRVKLRYLDEWNDGRRRVARRYGELLADSPVLVPQENLESHHVYHLFVIQHDCRDDLLSHLNRRGISCGVHYPHPLSQAAPYRNCRTVPDQLDVSMRLSKRILSLPVYPELMEEQIQLVADGIKAFTEVTSEIQATI